MKSGGYLALVNPCSGHIGPQSSSSDLESSSVKDHFGAINVEEVDNSVEEDQLSADENVAEEEEDDGSHLHANNNNNNKKSKLKRSLTLHERKKSLHRRKDKAQDFVVSKDHLFAQSAAWYFPRCFRQQPPNQQQQLDPDNEENLTRFGLSLAPTPSSNSSAGSSKSGSSLFVCKVLRKSLGQANRHSLRSKSDNCLHRLAGSGGSPGFGLATASSFSTRVSCNESFNDDDDEVFERVTSDPFKSPTNPPDLIIDTSHSSNNNNTNHQRTNATAKVFSLTRRVFDRVAALVGPHPPHSLATSSSSNSSSPKLTKKNGLTKTKSLERHFDCRIDKATTALAREQARRTRSLERNHRHLVTLDSACRYSREVGSHQIDLGHLLDRGSSDLSSRYQPDPTFKPRGPSGSPSALSSAAEVRTACSGADPTRPTSPARNPVKVSEVKTRPTTSTTMASASSSSSTQAPSSIVNKPARGWLHPDYLFAKDGINYNVRYIGCLEVNTSMKLLDFDTRSLIAKECINRVCESSGLKTVDKKRRTDKKVARMLSDTPSMEKAGANVQLTITSLWLKLSDLDSGQAIFVHEMPNISFASGGDADTLDFVAYVAKSNNVRSCYVLECGGGLAQDVITTIGQAFELRFKEFLKRTPMTKPPPLQMVPTPRERHHPSKPDEVEYYNDLPGKSPPDLSAGRRQQQVHKQDRLPRESVSSNLIDFNTEIPNSPEYVNGSVPNPRAAVPTGNNSHTGNVNSSGGPGSGHRDPFDMSPFATHPPGGGMAGLLASAAKGDSLRMQLAREDWFHGPISRKDAEMLLKNDGDFLVRESQGSPGQYVLTGMQSNSKKHLLLVDPEGIVRTKDRTFDSVSHLINFHRDNVLPIISAESALRLKTPVPHQRR